MDDGKVYGSLDTYFFGILRLEEIELWSFVGHKKILITEIKN